MINFKKVLEKYSLDPKAVQKALFPNHSMPYRAFLLLMNGKEMKESQVRKLAELARVEVSEIFKIQ